MTMQKPESMAHPIELIEFTDPYGTWCWGSEPVLRRIQETYGGQVKLLFVMGGFTDDADRVHDPANGIGGSDWKRQVAVHWVDASSRHGMPVDISQFAERVAQKSTYPANIAYEAARLQDPAQADRYLRRLREAAATESRSIQLPEIQADLAEEICLDRPRFLADLAGLAKEAFAEDQRLCREHGVQGFPTFLVSGGGRERILRGYTRFPAFAALFDSMADKPLGRFRSAINEASVLGFVGKYGSAATREVAEVFEVTDSDAEALLRQLVAKGQIEGHPAGAGTMYRMPMAGAYCDPLTGECG
jgi:predicted DsbA family dithiol-disulfide isomerase